MVAPTLKSVLGMCYEAQLTTPNPGKQLPWTPVSQMTQQELSDLPRALGTKPGMEVKLA